MIQKKGERLNVVIYHGGHCSRADVFVFQKVLSKPLYHSKTMYLHKAKLNAVLKILVYDDS